MSTEPRTISQKFLEDFKKIPAEGLAEVLLKMTSGNELFEAARELEATAYRKNLPEFDKLSGNSKSALGAILDFVNVDRLKFSKSWEPQIDRLI